MLFYRVSQSRHNIYIYILIEREDNHIFYIYICCANKEKDYCVVNNNNRGEAKVMPEAGIYKKKDFKVMPEVGIYKRKTLKLLRAGKLIQSENYILFFYILFFNVMLIYKGWLFQDTDCP